MRIGYRGYFVFLQKNTKIRSGCVSITLPHDICFYILSTFKPCNSHNNDNIK